MKMLIERVMEFTNVDARFAVVPGIELLQCTHGFPVIRTRGNTLAGRGPGCGLL